MDREEAKEKESCDKSVSEESKNVANGTKNPWKSYPQDSHPKFIGATRTPLD